MRKYLSLLLIPFLAFQIGCEDDDEWLPDDFEE